jgi:hypothetical protein
VPYDFHDTLNSAQDGLGFTADFRLLWRPSGRTAANDLLASHAGRLVRMLAEPIAGTGNVLRPQAVEQDISDRLLHQLPLRDDDVLVSWARVIVSVDPDTARVAEQLLRERQQARLAEHAQHQTEARMAFMRSQILRDPASARIYLLLDNSAQHGVLPPGAAVDELVREVQQWHPESRWVVIAQLLHTFLGKLTPGDAEELLKTLRALFTDFDQGELAQQLPPPATGGQA